MTTGSYWDVSNPDKPVGVLDPDEIKHIPYDFSEWLTGEGATYDSHTLESDDEMSAEDVAVEDGVILVRVKTTESAKLGEKYGVTCLCQASDGQKKSKTLFFKIKEL